jgi:hypothetical protein
MFHTQHTEDTHTHTHTEAVTDLAFAHSPTHPKP